MRRECFMIVAGEASGDAIGAELARELGGLAPEAEFCPTADSQPLTASFAPEFFGAGGPKMAEAGIELAADMTRYSAIGLGDVLRNYAEFRRIFNRLLKLAIERCPDVIVLVDFGYFNSRFAAAVKKRIGARRGTFWNWNPKIVQYVSPQVWASRPRRARRLARNVDLLLSIIPFEKEWYAARAPGLRVEFVGNPVFDRYREFPAGCAPEIAGTSAPNILLLPGSRRGELKRHLPVMFEAARRIAAAGPARFEMVLPDQSLVPYARRFQESFPANLELKRGGLGKSLSQAHLAIASTGTVTIECAYFGVPTLAIYKTTWGTYQVAKRIARVKHLAMPNLIAGKTLYPELIQHAATPEAIAAESLDLLDNEERRRRLRADLAGVIAELGGSGASGRAAEAVASLLKIRC